MSYFTFMSVGFPIGTLPELVIVIAEIICALSLAQLLEQWLGCEGKVWLPLGFTSTFVLAQVPEEASDTRHRPSALLDSQKLLG